MQARVHHRRRRDKTFLNGTLVSDIVIDTSQVATDTVQYVATLPTGQAGDPTGLTSTSTRTVIIEAASAPPPPSLTASSTPNTTASSTVQ